MRSWLCQWMYSSINASTSPRVCSSRRSGWTDSTFVPPRKPSAAASSSERPFAPVDPVGPNRSMGSSHPGRLWRRPRSECAGGRASSGNVAVDHRRGMRLAVRRLGLGDVRQPLLVGTFGGEVPERSGSHEGGSRLALVGTVPATSGTCAASPSPAMIRLIAFSETPVPGAALILRYP